MRPHILLSAMMVLASSASLFAQQNTVGTIRNESGTSPGYVLFAPTPSTTTYLVDNQGRQIRSWKSAYEPGHAAYLLENGDLLRAGQLPNSRFGGTGGFGGIIEKFSWDGTLLWSFTYTDTMHCLHHDLCPMPNGNVLAIAWEYKSAPEAVAAGRNPARLPFQSQWPDHIIEVRPVGSDSGEIVWEWHAYDHLVQNYDSTKPNFGQPAERPERIDINAPFQSTADWMHSNGIAYNTALDQILLTVHNFNEIWVLDHSTTTAEARSSTGGRSGRGGDILFRWGNPRNYGSGAQTDQKFFGMHDAQWIPEGYPGAGDMLIFNNGFGRSGARYSTVDEIVPPLKPDGSYEKTEGIAYGPADPVWTYKATPPESMFSSAISGAQRMLNGNTLICVGQFGRFLEVTNDGTVVWEYLNPVTMNGILAQGDTMQRGTNGSPNNVFKIRRYLPTHSAFTGRDLTPGPTVERSPTSTIPAESPSMFTLASVAPHPARGETAARVTLRASAVVHAVVTDMMGREVTRMHDAPSRLGEGDHILRFSMHGVPAGVYVLRVTADRETAARVFITE